MAFSPRRPPVVYENSVYIPAPIQGWNPDAPQSLTPDLQAPILDNLIPRNGWLRMRPGIRRDITFTSLLAGGTIVMGGFVGQSGNYLISRMTANTIGQVPYWEAVRAKVGVSTSTIMSGFTTLLKSQAGGGTVAVTADQIPGRRWQQFGQIMYGISLDASTAPTTSSTGSGGYTMKNVNLLTLTPFSGAGAPGTLTAYPTTAPRGAFDIKVYLNRIWLLGGVDVPSGGTTHSPARLHYTNPGIGGTLGTVAADWKDPVTAASNSFEIDQNYEDFGVGLATWRNQLIIFRANSVWVMTGSTSATFATRKIASEVGCLDAASIVETDHGVYFMSQRGFMFTDGVSVKNVSGPAQLALQDQATESVLARASEYAYCTAERMSTGDIFLTIGEYQGNLGALVPLWSAVYNPYTGVWWRYSSMLFSGDSAVVQPTTSYNFAGPLVSSVSTSEIYAVGRHTTVAVQAPYQQVLPDPPYDLDGGSYIPIPARWRTRNLPVITSTGRRRASLGGVYLDYAAPDTGNGAGTTFFMNLYYADRTQETQFSFTAPVGNAPIRDDEGLKSPSPFVQRFYSQYSQEIDDGSLEVFYSGPTQASQPGNPPGNYEIYGLGLRLTPAMDEPMP